MEYIYKVQPEDLVYAEEFRQRPIGHHSPGLQRVLSLFRGAEPTDRYVIFCTTPYSEWILAQVAGVQGAPIRFLRDKVFHSLEEAEWEVFKLRWQRHTGRDLERELVRVICGDTNPEGPGFKEQVVETAVNRRYKGRKQEIRAGSYVVVPSAP